LKTFGIDYNENYLFDWMEDWNNNLIRLVRPFQGRGATNVRCLWYLLDT
jgi:hypothetical protein